MERRFIRVYLGLTGFDRLCEGERSMQAHEGSALKTALKLYVARILTPWLLNLA
jgi:hypothetical protein